MIEYKMLAADMDGTLLNSLSAMTERTCAVMREADAAGCKVVICTGRIRHSVLPYIKMLGLDNPIIVANGAQVRYAMRDEILSEHLLPSAEALELIRLGRSMGAHARVYHTDDKVYVDEILPIDAAYSDRTRTPVVPVGDLCEYFARRKPLKVLNVMPDMEGVHAFIARAGAALGDRVYLTPGSDTFAECMNPLATKGRGVRAVAEYLNIPMEHVIAAGDHYNDITMLDAAGCSICSSNAQDAVKSRVDKVGKSNDEDGIALLIEEMVLRS
jgi:Cof subfamily protein (haloacid dehalogenase superfamily)